MSGKIKDLYTDTFSRTLIFACINLFVLSVIFITTLTMRQRVLYQEVDMKSSFLKGLSLAAIATVIFVVIDILSGGIASIIMTIIYPIAALTMLILSMINIPITPDIVEGDISRISAYRLWSIIFWPLFSMGMVVSLGVGALMSYLGRRMSKLVLDMLSRLGGNVSTANFNLASILASM